MRPFILLTLGNFGRTLPTGSATGYEAQEEKRKKEKYIRLRLIRLTCTRGQGIPEQGTAT